jgi:RNA polymerase sigma factor (TIGR02999 family)
MGHDRTSEVTQIIEAIEHGDAGASEALLPLVYGELRRLASTRLTREGRGHSIQATELVHEAYLRLIGPAKGKEPRWDGRGHFFAAAAESMRRILIDRARARGTSKRGGSWKRVSLDLSEISLDDVPGELIDLDASLRRFRVEEPAKAQLVELRFFAGLTMEQAASVMGISGATAYRYWAYARAWLFQDLKQGPGESEGE